MAKLPPSDALAWLHTLPMNRQTNQPAALLIAQCYSASKDWPGLRAGLEKQKWPELEFMRHAFLSRALRGQEMAESAKGEWEQALASANGQKQSLVMLFRLVAQWNWTAEGEDLLWSICNRYPGEKWAAQSLARALYLGGRTRPFMQLMQQELKRSPADLDIKNNLAITALLLEAKELKPNDLARETYEQAPVKSAYAATYAYSLYVQGKSAEALKVMRQLTPQDIEKSPNAGYYGIILKANGDSAQARIYLDKAMNSRLMPEERTLFERAKAGL
jgi:hypothetical protein